MSFSPNQVSETISSFILSVSLFAALDGTLARKKKIFSPFGSWIGMISERLEYMLIGLSFSWYIFSVTDDYITMYLCLLGYIFREGIGTLSLLTVSKMPPNWKEIYSKDFLYRKNSLIEFSVKAFFYTGTTYIILVSIGILFFPNFSFILFMAVYGMISYLLCLLTVGRRVHGIRI